MVDRFATCFVDGRVADQVEHTVAAMVGQRVYGIALGYEDVIRANSIPGSQNLSASVAWSILKKNFPARLAEIAGKADRGWQDEARIGQKK